MSNSTEACITEIIRQIEKNVRRGGIDGVIFNSCVDCDEARVITMPSTHIRVDGIGVWWKSQGSSRIRR